MLTYWKEKHRKGAEHEGESKEGSENLCFRWAVREGLLCKMGLRAPPTKG